MNTIVALATPPLKSTIHIIRLSGPNTYEIINKICLNHVSKEENSIQNNKIVDKTNNKIIDNILLMKFVKPKSFTGEDLIEINCHGNMMIVNKIISLIIKNDAIMAEPGEFTKQAFLNDKIDISQANSINYLINAKTDFQLSTSLDILLGKSKNKIAKLKEELFQVIGKLKVNIDYPEYYDVEHIDHNKMMITITSVNNELEKIINDYNNNFFLFNSINLVILGKPNSGKSSLLNKLIKQDRAIISDKEGTTRDFIKEEITIDGLNFNIIDTAGIRESKNLIEIIGIKKSLEILKSADLVLYLIDTSKKMLQEEIEWLKKNISGKYILVKNKSDINDLNKDLKGVNISAKENDINSLLAEIKKIFITGENNNFFIISDYEKNILFEVNNNIVIAKKLIQDNVSLEIILSYLEFSYKLLKSFIGEHKDPDLLDELFKNFCLGK